MKTNDSDGKFASEMHYTEAYEAGGRVMRVSKQS